MSSYSTVNSMRKQRGEEEIPYTEFKREFKNTRGSTGRTIGTIAGLPLFPIGSVAGYYLGKSSDNEKAARNLIEKYREKA